MSRFISSSHFVRKSHVLCVFGTHGPYMCNWDSNPWGGCGGCGPQDQEGGRKTGEGGCVTFEADSSVDFQCYQQRKERESSRNIRVMFLPTLGAGQAFHQVHVIERYDGSSVMLYFLRKSTTSNKTTSALQRACLVATFA